jgi:hypothetical protein
MKAFIAIAAVLLLAPAWASAQNLDPQSSYHQPHGLGYIFVGYGSRQMGQTEGFGGEAYLAKGLGVTAEVGTTGRGTKSNGNPNWIGVGSLDFAYHLFLKRTHNQVAPFVTGGYSNFFGQDTDTPGGNLTNGYNLGGGIDLLAAKHVGMRFDFRYFGHGGRILWASFPTLPQFSFAAFRVGLTFR